MEFKEVDEYRAKLLDRILVATDEFCSACQAVPDPFKPIQDGWNTHQLAAHTQDVDASAYGLRVRRMLVEEYPLFKNYDGDEWIATQYRPDVPLTVILMKFRVSVREMVEMLKSQPREIWSRLSRHEMAGEITLQKWVERHLAHIEEHLETVREAR